MNYDYSISPENKFVHVIGKGEYGIKDIKKLVKIVTSDERYCSDFNSIIDIRDVKYTPIVSEVIELSDFFIVMKKSFKSKVAIVVKSEMLYNLFKISAHYTNKNNIKTNIFIDLEKAKEWFDQT